MNNGMRLKICGLTSVEDAQLADRAGADYLGFILHPKSPRYISLGDFRALAPQLPPRPKVAVSVEPADSELAAMREAGFDYFQVHCEAGTAAERLHRWSADAGAGRLWLAPRLPPERDVPEAVLAAAKSILLDTYQAGGFGGSGRTGDWGKFARHQAGHPDHAWILAGGLNAENIDAAIRHSGARFVDVSSGVERSPGVKDPTRLAAFAVALRRAADALG